MSRPQGLAAAVKAMQEAAQRPPRPGEPHPLLAAVGGIRGIVDSSIPATVFVVANALAGLRAGVIAALASAVAIGLLRAARREPLQQAVTGLAGVGVAAFVALRLHSSTGYFLPGIVINVGYGLAALASVLIGRPAVGYVAAVVEPRLRDWRTLPGVRRTAALATLVWVAVFAVRIAVQVPLYLAGRTGLLATAKIAMGWPLWALAAGASFLLLRKAAARLDQDSDLPS